MQYKSHLHVKLQQGSQLVTSTQQLTQANKASLVILMDITFDFKSLML